jgi:hypothetical protein
MAFASSSNNSKTVNREFILKTIAANNGSIPMFSATGVVDTLVYRTTANTDTDTTWLSTVGWVTANFPKLVGNKIPESYLPDSIVGQVEYKGVWNANTNSPTLSNPTSAATKGHYYIVNTAGTLFTLDFQVGDWVISNGDTWSKVDNTDAVTSINNMLGAITIQQGTNISVTNSNGVVTINNTYTTPSGLAYLANAQTFSGTNTFSSAVVLSTQATTTSHAVRADRSVSSGTGLTGGGDMTANRTLSLDLTYTDSRYQAAGSYVTLGTAQDITATKTLKNANIAFDNRATGTPTYPSNKAGIEWITTSDKAGMHVYERDNDKQDFTFWMSDNISTGYDRFVYKIEEFRGRYADAEGVTLAVGTDFISNQKLTTYGGMVVKGTPTLGVQRLPNRLNPTLGAQDVTIIRNNQAFWNPDLGSSTLTLSVDVATATNTVIYPIIVKIKSTNSPNTFCWGISPQDSDVNDPSKWLGNDIPVSTNWITLNNGIKIKFNTTTGGVVGETFGFSVLPAGDLTVDRDIFEGGVKLSSKYAALTHSHTNATTGAAGFMSNTDKTKLDGIATNANNYSHPTGDGNLHVPVTGTTNNLKVLKAGATAGVFAWGSVAYSELTGVPSTFTPSTHTHSEYLLKTGGTITGSLDITGTMTVTVADFKVGEGLVITDDNNYWGTNLDARILRMVDMNGTNGAVDGGLVIEAHTSTDGISKEILTVRDTNNEFKYKGSSVWHTGNLTGAANSVVSSNLTSNRAMVSDASGKIAIAATTATEIGYLSGVTSAVQTQLDGKSATSHSHTNATTGAAGFMSNTDKSKLDGIATNANNYSHPTGDGNLHVPVTGTTNNLKVLKAGATAGVFAWGNVAYSELTGTPSTFTPSAHTHTIADVTGLQTALDAKSDSSHTHSNATTGVAGFMSNTDKSKLDGIAASANNYSHPTGDGNLHVPVTGTTNNLKVLKAGATAGVFAWGNVAYSELTGTPSTFTPSAHTHAIADVTGLQTALDAKEGTANKGVASGYASLDTNAKIPTSQLPDSVLGQVSYQGTYNANTNTPTLSTTPASTTKGNYYVVSVAGTFNSVEYQVGDWIISNGTSWDKVDNTDSVSSVYGRMGAVVAVAGDYTASQITNTPAGGITAITVQAALNDLDTSKSSTSHTHSNATTGVAGFMSNTDKSKLDGIAASANNYSHPTGDGNLHVPVTGTTNNLKVLKAGATAGVFAWGNVAYSELTGTPSSFTPSAHTHAIADVTGLQTALDAKSDSSHTHSNATTGVAGFMSNTDKTKLDGIAASANNYSHPTGDGNLHVPATGTTNNGKFLMAGLTAGSLSWGTPTDTTYTAGTGLSLTGTSFSNIYTTLSTMTDVSFATLANNQLMRYNTSNSKWENWTPNYLTSYTESDTLATVTGRGNTTTSVINLTNTTASTSTSTGALLVSGGVGVGGSLYANALFDNGNRVLTSFTETDTLATVTARGATTATALTFTNSTASTSTTTGAVRITGGLGVAAAIHSATLNTTGNITNGGFDFVLGSVDQVTRGNSNASRALVKASLNGGAGLYLNYLSDFAGGTSIGGNNVYIPATTASTSTITGAMIVSGGVGVAGSLYAAALFDNGNRVLTSLTDTLATVTGRGATTSTALTFTNSTASSSTTTGALVVTGGIGVGGVVRTTDVYTSAVNGKGIGFWNSDSFKIYMSTSVDATWGGRMDTTSDNNMYFRMSGGTNRGFAFQNGSTSTATVAQIDGAGNFYAKASIDAPIFKRNGSEKFVEMANIMDGVLLTIEDVPFTERAKLVDPDNWTGHQYTGAPLIGCLQGTEFDDGFHIYKFVQDNTVRRLQYV